jgi:hypothetical protein
MKTGCNKNQPDFLSAYWAQSKAQAYILSVYIYILKIVSQLFPASHTRSYRLLQLFSFCKWAWKMRSGVGIQNNRGDFKFLTWAVKTLFFLLRFCVTL